MVSTNKDAATAFNLLKSKKPGDNIRVRDESGQEIDVTLIRRGRRNARVKLITTGELLLIPLEDVLLTESEG